MNRPFLKYVADLASCSPYPDQSRENVQHISKVSNLPGNQRPSVIRAAEEGARDE